MDGLVVAVLMAAVWVGCLAAFAYWSLRKERRPAPRQEDGK